MVEVLLPDLKASMHLLCQQAAEKREGAELPEMEVVAGMVGRLEAAEMGEGEELPETEVVAGTTKVELLLKEVVAGMVGRRSEVTAAWLRFHLELHKDSREQLQPKR